MGSKVELNSECSVPKGWQGQVNICCGLSAKFFFSQLLTYYALFHTVGLIR